MKKIFYCLLVLLIFISSASCSTCKLYAESFSQTTIYDQDGTYITTKQGVEIGDNFITAKGLYEIVEFSETDGSAKALKIEEIDLPEVIKNNVSNISTNAQNKTIGLYSTHNDESYINGDGVDSLYGQGGVIDVANKLKEELEKLGTPVVFDDTLHLPHDTSAYSRSKETAQELLNSNATAIFDIHRDAGSRNSYIKNVNGKEVCQVRMVVGKANPNYEKNLEFALYLFDVAKTISPNLFLDIYMAKGHYNQELSSKAILFEFGTEQVEKDLVLSSTKELAKVINTTLFKTSVEEDGTLSIGSLDKSNSINVMLASPVKQSTNETNSMIIFTLVSLASIVCYVVYLSRSKIYHSL